MILQKPMLLRVVFVIICINMYCKDKMDNSKQAIIWMSNSFGIQHLCSAILLLNNSQLDTCVVPNPQGVLPTFLYGGFHVRLFADPQILSYNFDKPQIFSFNYCKISLNITSIWKVY